MRWLIGDPIRCIAAIAVLCFAEATVLWAMQQEQPKEPLPAEATADKRWEVTCALPGQQAKEWIVTMPRPLCHESGHYLIMVEGKEVLVPVSYTIIEESK